MGFVREVHLHLADARSVRLADLARLDRFGSDDEPSIVRAGNRRHATQDEMILEALQRDARQDAGAVDPEHAEAANAGT